MKGMREVSTREGIIRLGQFLKLADAVEVGSDVKLLLGEGSVLVNGEVENRRGRQLVRGEIVGRGRVVSARQMWAQRQQGAAADQTLDPDVGHGGSSLCRVTWSVQGRVR